jgi:hypothetical protein
LHGFGRRRGHVLDFIILIGWKILIRRFTEEGVPVGAVEVGELGWIATMSQCIQYPVPVLHSRLYYSLTIRNAQDQSCSNQEQ